MLVDIDYMLVSKLGKHMKRDLGNRKMKFVYIKEKVLSETEQVYVFFNNDFEGHAIHNAQTFQKLIGD